MIHKFWNVRLASSQEKQDKEDVDLSQDTTDEAGRNAVRDLEERMEEKVYKIWSVLSTFEESSAACISDMLLHVSNGAYVDGVLVAKKFIWHVDILFRSADKLDSTMSTLGPKGKHLSTYPQFYKHANDTRIILFERGEVTVQEDRSLLLTSVEKPGGRRQKAWRHSRAACAGNWSCSLSEASDQNMLAGRSEGRTRASKFGMSAGIS